MGGGGGAHWSKTHVNDLRRELDVIKKAAEESTFSTDVAGYLNGLLANANNRDNAEIDRRLNAILDSIKEETEGTIRLTYAGSVAKHTWDDGLSDVDVLLKVTDSELAKDGPTAIRDHIASQIR